MEGGVGVGGQGGYPAGIGCSYEDESGGVGVGAGVGGGVGA